MAQARATLDEFCGAVLEPGIDEQDRSGRVVADVHVIVGRPQCLKTSEAGADEIGGGLHQPRFRPVRAQHENARPLGHAAFAEDRDDPAHTGGAFGVTDSPVSVDERDLIAAAGERVDDEVVEGDFGAGHW
nr:hypothetical protein [Amycolatopsis methanolica]